MNKSIQICSKHTLSALFFLFSSWSYTQISEKEKPLLSLEKTQIYDVGNGKNRIYPKPVWHEMITRLPRDFVMTSKDFIQKDHAYYLGAAVGATIIAIPYDQKLTDASIKLADHFGLNHKNKYGKLGPLKIVPKNMGSALYFVGNGTTVILMSAGFLSYGLLKNDYRAYATASGLIESLALSGVYIQAAKRITGRESPVIARENGNPGGAWHPFPSFAAYANHTPRYDAMPSGHLATIMAGLTVVTTNYPEYKWIKPVGYTFVGAMCFQMMQSEVHWFSDYPLAILIGYFSGKNIAKNRFKEKDKSEDLSKKNNIQYSYRFTGGNIDGINTLGIAVHF